MTLYRGHIKKACLQPLTGPVAVVESKSAAVAYAAWYAASPMSWFSGEDGYSPLVGWYDTEPVAPHTVLKLTTGRKRKLSHHWDVTSTPKRVQPIDVNLGEFHDIRALCMESVCDLCWVTRARPVYTPPSRQHTWASTMSIYDKSTDCGRTAICFYCMHATSVRIRRASLDVFANSSLILDCPILWELTQGEDY